MSMKEKIVSQAVEPRGTLGWVTAWVMPLFSDAYCGDLAELLQLQPDDEVLEVACGSGTFLQKRASCARYVAGLDHSDIQFQMARKRVQQRIDQGTAEIVKGDSAHLPWPDGRFTAVTCNCVGCFAQPQESLREMWRVLQPRGRAAFGFDYYPTKEAARKAAEWWGLPTWTESEVRTILEKAGFAQIRLSHDKRTLLAAAVKP